MALLRTHNLTIGYCHGDKKTDVMSGLNLDLQCGRLTAMLGSNGIGKSTLLRTIAGSQPALAGSITLNDKPIESISKKELSRLMSLVYTDRTQAGGLTVRELVSLGRQPHTGFLGRLGADDYDVVDKAIADAGISHKANSYLAELSDGERQKAMIAKALAQETPIIILDEPTAFLDVASRIETMRLLHTLAHTANKAILLSSHDISQTLLLADNLWVVTSERTVLNGMTEDLILDGAMQRMFSADNIRFDMALGDFEACIPAKRYVSLECGEKQLKRWLVNALRRNGIGIDASSPDSITVMQGNKYVVNVKGQSRNVSSIKEVIAAVCDRTV